MRIMRVHNTYKTYVDQHPMHINIVILSVLVHLKYNHIAHVSIYAQVCCLAQNLQTG
jgi:hypothetical protein